MLRKVLTELKATVAPTPPTKPAAAPKRNKPILTTYASLPVPLPKHFLSTNPSHLPYDAQPITVNRIDFANSPIPEYDGLYAVVLDHVLSPSECAALLRLAEASVPAPGEPGAEQRLGADDAWAPALVNVGRGYEVLDAGYRNGERIVWDEAEVVGRLWGRCLSAGGQEGERLRERFKEIGDGERDVHGVRAEAWGKGRWVFERVNERMRFLRYGKGGFFKSHCDAPYHDDRDPARKKQTMFTIHLYLNDSKAEDEDAELVGGATTFYSNDEKRRMDVHPKAGRVLIFQHRRLLHSGDDVKAGTKYTMRTDIVYEWVRDDSAE